MKKLFCLMGIISSYAYPSFATNTEMEALLELAMSSRTSQEDVLDRLFPEGHSFHPRSSQHLNLQEFRKLKEIACLPGQEPGRKLLLLMIAAQVYNQTVFDLRQIPENRRRAFAPIDQLTISPEELEVFVEEGLDLVDASLASFVPMLESTDASMLKKVSEDFKHILKTSPQDQAKLRDGLISYNKTISQIRDRLECESITIADEMFDPLLQAPQMCPKKATDWRIYALNLAQLYVPRLTGNKTERWFQAMQTFYRELEVSLKDLNDYDSMKSLLEPWSLDIFRIIRSFEPHLCPAALPAAALHYNWAQLSLGVLFKTHDPTAEQIEDFFQHAFLAADILEKKDQEPGLLSINKNTMGISRTLAILFLHQTMRDLQMLHERQILNAYQLTQYRTQLRKKARGLALNMNFTPEQREVASRYQSSSFARVADLHDDVINKFVWLLAAGQESPKTFEGDIYRDVLIERYDAPTLNLIISGAIQNPIQAYAEEVRSEAYAQALAKADAFRKEANEQTDSWRKLVLLWQANQFYALSLLIDVLQRDTHAIYDEVEASVELLVEQCRQEWIAKINQTREACVDLSKKERLKALSQLYMELFGQIGRQISDASRELSSSIEEYRCPEFSWIETDLRPWAKKLEDFLPLFKDEIDEEVEAFLSTVFEPYLLKAKTTTEPLKLADELEEEISSLQSFNLFRASQWQHVPVLLELRMRPQLNAVKGARQAEALLRACSWAKLYLEKQKTAFPKVFNDFDKLVASELNMCNAARIKVGLKPPLSREEYLNADASHSWFLRMYGWSPFGREWLPTVWGDALIQQRDKLMGAIRDTLKTFVPTIESLDATAMHDMVIDLELLRDQSDIKAIGFFEERLSVYINLLKAWSAILASVDWQNISVDKYKSVLASIESSYNSCVAKDSGSEELKQQVKRLATQCLLDAIEKQPLEACVSDLRKCAKMSFTDEQHAKMTEVLKEKVQKWIAENKKSIYEAHQVYKHSNGFHAPLEAAEAVSSLVQAYHTRINESIVAPSCSRDDCMLNSGEFKVSIPMKAFNLDPELEGFDTTVTKLRLYVRLKDSKNALETLRAEAYAVNALNIAQVSKIKDKATLKAEAQALLERLGSPEDYKAIRGMLNDYTTLKIGVEEFIEKL